MDKFFRNSFNSTKSRSTGFTNLINLNFQWHLFSKKLNILKLKLIEKCALLSAAIEEKIVKFLLFPCTFLRTFWNCHFLIEIYKTLGLRYVIPRVYFYNKTTLMRSKMFVLPDYFGFYLKELKQPACCTDSSQGGHSFGLSLYGQLQNVHNFHL